MKGIFLIAIITAIFLIPITLGDKFTCTISGSNLNCNSPTSGTDANLTEIIKILNRTEKSVNTTVSNNLAELLNRTRIRIETSGTEYLPNESATIFARVLDGNSRPINLASCNSTIYFPNKTKFVDNQALTLLEKGIYYHDFTVPNILGNYIVSFDCNIPANVFDVNRTHDTVITVANPSFNGEFAFDNSNNLTINNAYLEFKYDQSPSGQFRLAFGNNVIFTSTIGADTTTNITLTSSNFSIAETQNYNFELISATGNAEIFFVKLFVNYTSLEPQQIVRGQNEVHVSSLSTVDLNVNATELNNSLSTFSSFDELQLKGTEYISNETGIITAQFLKVTSGTPNPVNDGTCQLNVTFPNRSTLFMTNQNLTYLNNSNGIYTTNFTVPSEEGIYVTDARCFKGASPVFASGTFHVSNTLINEVRATNSSIFSFLGNINSKIDSIIGNFTTLGSTFLSNIASSVWSFGTRTLTDFNFEVNLTQFTINQTADKVWTYPNRTISNATFVTNVTNVETVQNVTAVSENVLDDIASKVISFLIGLRHIE